MEKLKRASGLRDESRRTTGQWPAARLSEAELRTSRTGTAAHEELDRNGTDARFAAHVLGQILAPARENPRQAARAYAATMRRQRPARLIEVL